MIAPMVKMRASYAVSNHCDITYNESWYSLNLYTCILILWYILYTFIINVHEESTWLYEYGLFSVVYVDDEGEETPAINEPYGN